MALLAQARYWIDRLIPHVRWVNGNALKESLLFLTVLFIINLLVGDGTRFFYMDLHPFWIIVILIAVQYGTTEGMIAAGLSTVYLLAWNIPEQPLDQSIYDYWYVILNKPLMWMVAAVIVGQIRMRHVNEQHETKRSLAIAKRRLKMLLHAFSDLRDTKEILERRLASNLNSTILAYKNITSFDNTSRSRFLLEVEDIVMNTLHPKKVSLYIFGEQGFEVITSMGWSDDERYARRIDSKSPLHQAMVKTRRAVCAINKQDEKILGGEGVLAAPLIDSRDDSVFGMIKIEEMALADLNLNSTQIFEALSQWISTMYVTTSEYNALKQQVESNSDKKKSGVKRKKATTPKK
jgi:hypothetical protein